MSWLYGTFSESESCSVLSYFLRPRGLYSLWNSPDQNIGVGSCFLLQLMFPSPGDLPNPEIEPRSPILQVDSLPAEPQGKPKNTGVVVYPFSSGSSQTRNQTGVSCIAGRFFTNQAIREALMQQGYLLLENNNYETASPCDISQALLF